MSAQKKILTKKSVIYISLIFFTISGAGFMLYQNKKPTAGESTEVNLSAAAESSRVLDVNQNGQSGGFNLNIFFSDKFKNLRANPFIVKERPETGKRDPFKPN